MQEQRTGTGRTTTDMQFGAFARTHLRETVSLTPYKWPNLGCYEVVDPYACFAALVVVAAAVYSGL